MKKSKGTGGAVRDTSQRRAIRAALDRAGRPLSAGEILDAARKAVPGLGVATVYRAVRTLQADGALHQVNLPGDSPRYELSGKKHHHHFHCLVCSGVFEVHDCPGELEHLSPPGFVLERHEVILYGRCRACARRRYGRGAARGRGRNG
jgi:Fur family ferric uptake transcriptional regulator